MSQAGVCGRCRETPPKYAALRSWAEFADPVRRALHELKYKKNVGLGEALSRAMIICLRSQNWEIDLVMPVPLGNQRAIERGYNQAALLARPLAFGLGLAYNPQALNRARETRSQVGLSATERRQNVDGAFVARPELVAGKNVLVVDDVTTTGSTLNACAEALSLAGARKTYGITLARAVWSAAQQ